ncbi:T-complex protein 11-like protein 2 isoform X3 [Oncorhynchus tshawytscha]|uniref:T-complex protein 11-like protein 2 isoform X3 n=1 Tax=Oncorhynchus tshawytscha TaxID=74940 RepID=UPI001C3C64EA|nr:T-complex protein 11-like protein 2 isoform X3 [Oncorhynchus tshawytscha]
MSSARDLSNLTLAHEIIVNRDFHVEQPHLPQNSLEKQVKDIVHKAFWDGLESELNDDPPEYEHTIKLLEEIREILLSFLSPGANRLRTQILEVLDMDLIRQQADKEAVDIHGLASYIIAIMGKLCAPVRDDEVKKLRESPDNVASMYNEGMSSGKMKVVGHLSRAAEAKRRVAEGQDMLTSMTQMVACTQDIQQRYRSILGPLSLFFQSNPEREKRADRVQEERPVSPSVS